MNCIKCGRDETAYHFRVLQVRTLHVRDLDKEKRVQALGDFEEYEVCAACTEEKYRTNLDSRSAIVRTVLLWGTVMLAGLVLTVLLRSGDGVFRLLGLAMLLGGGLCLFSGVRSADAKRREMTAMTREKALYACAWECLVDGAPKKDDITDLSYIPVDEETLARKNGDLMILYDLLPELAIEAHKRIHGQEEENT